MTKFVIIKDWPQLPPPPQAPCEVRIYHLMGHLPGGGSLDYVGFAIKVHGSWYAVVQQDGGQMAEVVCAGHHMYDVPRELWQAIRQDPDLWQAVDQEFNARVYEIIREMYPDAPSGVGDREVFIANYNGRDSLVALRVAKVYFWRPGWPPSWVEVERWEPVVRCTARKLPEMEVRQQWLPALVFASSPEELEALRKLCGDS